MTSTELIDAERVVFARLREEGDVLARSETRDAALFLDVMDDIDLIMRNTASAPLSAECKLVLSGYDKTLWSRRTAC